MEAGNSLGGTEIPLEWAENSPGEQEPLRDLKASLGAGLTSGLVQPRREGGRSRPGLWGVPSPGCPVPPPPPCGEQRWGQAVAPRLCHSPLLALQGSVLNPGETSIPLNFRMCEAGPSPQAPLKDSLQPHKWDLGHELQQEQPKAQPAPSPCPAQGHP